MSQQGQAPAIESAMISVRNILLVATLLASAGCSLPQLAYQQAPAYLAGEFDDAFDLDDAQSQTLDARLQQFFAWHRSAELGHYQAVLERAALDSSDGIRADEFLRLQGEIYDAWRRAVAKVIDSVGDLALTLTPAQVAAYEAYYDERSEKYREYRAMTLQQREIYRLTRDIERLEKWFGDFDGFIEDRVEERLRRLPDIYEPWLRYREARHRALVAALRDAPRQGLDAARLKHIMLGTDTDYARVYEPERLAYWQAYAEALEDISGWVDAQQQRRLVSRLRDYARIIEDLGRG